MTYRFEYLNDSDSDAMYSTMASHVGRLTPKSVLDLGCGYARWLEHFTLPVKLTGVDDNDQAITHCRTKYAWGEFHKENAWEYDDGLQYDVIVLGGFLYYAKGSPYTPMSFIQKLIERFSPKQIVIQEPLPWTHYNSPDFSEILDSYAWSASNVSIPVRMGERVVWTIYTDQKRPLRKIKAQHNGVSLMQQDFDDNMLKNGVYTANTENLNSERDGQITPLNPRNHHYVSVCAGFKGLYKAALDHYSGKNITFTWVDISQSAVNYRMFVDRLLAQDHLSNPDYILDRFKKEYNPDMVEINGSGKDLSTLIQEQLDELGISQLQWQSFLKSYAHAPKNYIRLDAVNNVKLLADLLDSEKPYWMWYSNIFDWHQFRHKEDSFNAWEKYLINRIPGISLHGHRPPFTSS